MSEPVKEPRERRIQPVRLTDLPSVLDVEQASNVLRVSVERVRDLTNQGQLRRLRYTRQFLYDAREILRFLEEQTAVEGDDRGEAA